MTAITSPHTPGLPVLYFIHATGCPGCEIMRPVVGRFWKANQHRLRVVPVDLTRAEWKAKEWEPDMTPTCILRYADGTLYPEKHEGFDGEESFVAWIEKALAAARRR